VVATKAGFIPMVQQPTLKAGTFKTMTDYDGCSRDCRSERWRWSRVEPPATSEATPPAGLVSLAYDEHSQRVILFGGEGASGAPGNETWLLQLNFKANRSAWPPGGGNGNQ